jgi:hypothetical protein
VSPIAVPRWSRRQQAGESSFYSRSLALPSTEAKKYQRLFSDIENNKVDVEKQASNGYVAMVQHYFCVCLDLGGRHSA